MDNKSKVTLKFYTITSNFNDILLRLCKKIIDSEEKVYVNFETDETKKTIEKLKDSAYILYFILPCSLEVVFMYVVFSPPHSVYLVRVSATVR